MRNLLLAGVCTAALMGNPALADDIKQGGEMTVTYKDDVSTLDPAIGYDWQNWSMIKSLFDGLMDYVPGTTELRPDLAESYEISEDGKIFTFKLRKGVKFHNGRELTAQDVKYSIERVVNPATQSPGAGFFATIKGVEEASAGKGGELSGITVQDPHTIRFELTRPDATFLHVMALNFAHVVPKEEVEKHGADFGKNPVGSGAFKLAEWTLGQRLVFERFTDYWNEGLPKLDRITFEVGQEPVVALLRLQNGEIDVPGDGIPPAKFVEVTNDPNFKDLIIRGGQLHTGYVTMNVKMAPFDKVEVRKAVNMAINKDRILRIINGRAVAANQPLPPSMPGYAKDYAGYAYDPEGAKKLLEQAGLGDGFSTELYVMNTDPQPRIAQAIQQDLKAIGITASIKSLAQANVIAAGGEENQAPMIWSGGMAWIADFPDPSNFYGPILGCGGAVPGGWNWSWYCNEELDKKAAEADAIADPAKAAEREALWRDIYLKIMEDAPWAPIFNEERFTIRSERIGGDDKLFVDPVHIPVHYDQVYAKDVQ
ncbi:ABC transporter substrate-binding protein [Sinorhizobium meliloti]|jgi:ABC-type transport system substrate-binding protein|uniref:Peptide-binding periplasmic ABC transporter n=5 Tax=Rhizobium meliloti TaxID=382 RepID=Q92P42_RHIME|nr:ABC transporter substrate-binding protein [Sinorhizobium meliloti]PST25904.1 ABC transporter substrate-binding protein [Mesorhizobium loti]AEG04673.1 ABC-type transporter, periplasmic subunit [Sinorhizobium meliloti BL225C]AEG53648.1 ABC-type transporter, periplasmic subunit [Sinorhizobium meliloti AK83]AEH78655.1 putative peptide-binding periplasmic ABC transporter protein [Sinorhizobium meliloti SM11]AGA06933.1 ABC-type dipeptide transport system, periplasmic component [Sinorhizobium meli